MTHFPSADESGGVDFTRGQIGAFLKIRDAAEAAGMRVPLWHAANSAGILLHPDSHWTRSGPPGALRRIPGRAGAAPAKLRQAMTLKTRIVLVRDFPRRDAGLRTDFPDAARLAHRGAADRLCDGFSRANSNKGTR